MTLTSALIAAALALLAALHGPAYAALTAPNVNITTGELDHTIAATTTWVGQSITITVNTERSIPFDEFGLALVLAHESRHVRDYKDGVSFADSCAVESRGLATQVETYRQLVAAKVPYPQPPSYDTSATAYLSQIADKYGTDNLAHYSVPFQQRYRC